MRINNCNCGRKIDCGCGTLSFDTYSPSTDTLLTVGNLISSGCSLDGYAIEWYRNCVFELLTGVGNDDFDAIHPLIGTNSVPVPAGTYVPVVRYIIVNGQKLLIEPKPCENWCIVETDLPEFIIVTGLNCNSTNQAANNYQYRIQYSGRTENTAQSRSFYWDLPEDNSAGGMGFMFTAVIIADKIEVFLNNESNLLAHYIIGVDAVTTNHSLSPPRVNIAFNVGFRFMVTFPDYTPGDKVLIKITPSVLQPWIKDTDWTLDMKCLPRGADTAGCVAGNPSDRRGIQANSYTFIDNTDLCRRIFSIKLTSPFTNYGQLYPLASTYGQLGGVNQGAIGYDSTEGITTFNLNYSSLHQTEHYQPLGYSQRVSSAGKLTFTKTGTTIVISSENPADISNLQSNYNDSLNSPWWLNRHETDTKNAAFYRAWILNLQQFQGSCESDPIGGAMTLYIHHKSEIIFSSNSVTINLFPVTYQLDVIPCDSRKSTVNNYVDQITNTYNRADFSMETYCMNSKWFGWGAGIKNTVTKSVSRAVNGGYSLAHNAYGKQRPCSYAGWCRPNNTGWTYIMFYVRLEMDLAVDPLTRDFPRDEDDNYIQDPLKFFTLYDIIQADGCVNQNDKSKPILKVVNGQITIPIPS